MHVRDGRGGRRAAWALAASVAVTAAWAAAAGAEMMGLEEPARVAVQREGEVLRGELIAWGDEVFELRDGEGEVTTVRWAELAAAHAASLQNRVLGRDATGEDYLAMARRIGRIDDPQAGAIVRQVARRAMGLDESLREEAEAVIAAWEARRRDGRAGEDDEAAPEGGGAPGAATPEHLLWPAMTDEEHQEAIEESLTFARRVADELELPLQLYESEYFLLCTDMPPREAEHWYGLLDDMYRTLMRMFGQPPDENIWRGKAMVLLLATREDYHRLYEEIYERDPGTAVGRCHYMPNGNVHITMFRGSRSRQRIEGTLVHESTHGFVYRYRSRAGIPSWVNEGLAEWAEYQLVPELLPGVASRVRERLRQRGTVDGMFEAGSIDPWQYGVAYTITDLLIEQDSGGYVDFFHGIKDGMGWEESLEAHYGVTVEQLLDGYARSMRLRDGLRR